LRILQRIAKRLDLDNDEDGAPDELARETSVDEIARDLREREKSEKQHDESEGGSTKPAAR
jgi:hypothetical protein